MSLDCSIAAGVRFSLGIITTSRSCARAVDDEPLGVHIRTDRPGAAPSRVGDIAGAGEVAPHDVGAAVLVGAQRHLEPLRPAIVLVVIDDHPDVHPALVRSKEGPPHPSGGERVHHEVDGGTGRGRLDGGDLGQVEPQLRRSPRAPRVTELDAGGRGSRRRPCLGRALGGGRGRRGGSGGRGGRGGRGRRRRPDAAGDRQREGDSAPDSSHRQPAHQRSLPSTPRSYGDRVVAPGANGWRDRGRQSACRACRRGRSA